MKTRPRLPRLFSSKKLVGLLLISPWLIGALLLKLFPILASFALSLTDFHMLSPADAHFVGLDNFIRFFGDQTAWYLLFQTLAQALISLPLQVIASIALAALLNQRALKGRGLLRTLFFLPSIIPSVAILFMWRGFTDPATGWLKRLLLDPIGLANRGGLFVQAASDFLFAVSFLWSIGPGMLILLSALQGVQAEVLEAARVDGAGPITRFTSITFPIISPAIFFTIIINLITIFGGVILLDRGNLFSGGSSPYDSYLSFQMFNQFNLGYAAALAWAFFLFALSIVFFLFRTSKRWVFYAEDSSEK